MPPDTTDGLVGFVTAVTPFTFTRDSFFGFLRDFRWLLYT